MKYTAKNNEKKMLLELFIKLTEIISGKKLSILSIKGHVEKKSL